MITGVEHTSFVVSDLDRSIEFYRLLGAKVEWRADRDTIVPLRAQVGYPDAVISIAQLVLPGGTHRLELIQYLTPTGAARPPERCGIGAAHLCLTVDDIQAEVRRLKAARVAFVSEPQYFDDGPDAGVWAVYFLDPDGITMELTQGPSRPVGATPGLQSES